MARLFKSTFIINYIIGIGGLLIALILHIMNIFNDGDIIENSVAVLVFIIFWAVIIPLSVNYFFSKEILKIQHILFEECDPEPYIDTLKKKLILCSPKIRKYILLMISTGYLQTADFEKAKEYLDEIKGFPKGANWLPLKANYYNDLTGYYSIKEDFDNHIENLNNMNDVLQNSSFPLKSKSKYLRILELHKVRYNLGKGLLNGSEESFLISSFDKELNKINRVSIKYALGMLFIHYNRLDEAKEAFEYVIQNGNKLYCVEKAKELLSGTE